MRAQFMHACINNMLRKEIRWCKGGKRKGKISLAIQNSVGLALAVISRLLTSRTDSVKYAPSKFWKAFFTCIRSNEG